MQPLTQREQRAFCIACRIIRGVFQHPSGFSAGFMPAEDFDPFKVSVMHRLSQLGFGARESYDAYLWAFECIAEEHEKLAFPEVHWWGRA